MESSARPIMQSLRVDDDHSDKDNSSVDSFFITVGINIAIFIALMIIFLFLRSCRFSPRLFNLRRYFNARAKGVKHVNNKLPYIKVPVYDEVDVKRLGKKTFPWGSFTWVWPVLWGYDDKTFLRTHGADAVMYTTFVRNCFILCCALALPSLVVILPVNSQGGNDSLDSDSDNYITGMGIITLSNVPVTSSLLTAHIVFTYVYSILAYIFIIVTYKQFISIRKAFMAQNCGRSYTIMVEELPYRLRTDEALFQFFDKNFPGNVMAAHVAYDTDDVRDMMKKRKKYINGYEAAFRKVTKKTLAGIPWPLPGGKYGPEYPKTTTGFHGKLIGVPMIGDEVDAKEFFKRKIMKYEKLIEETQANPAATLKPTRVGFVTFDTPFFARAHIYGQMGALVKSSRRDWNVLNMTIRPAPDPTDVRWVGLTVNRWFQLLRTIAISIVMVVVIFFWFFPTLVIASFANLEALSQNDGLTWLSFVSDLPGAIRGFIQGFLPPIMLLIINSILYPLIKFAHCVLQGVHVKSEAMWHVMVVYWVFLVVNVLLVMTIGSAVLRVISDVISSPLSIFTLLASSLPQQSLFFMLYIITSGVSRKPLSLFRIGNAFKWTLGLLTAANPKQQNFAQIPGAVDLAQNSAIDMLIFAIVMVYCLLSPLVPAFGVMYYGMIYLTSRHNLIYAHVAQWESGGLAWSRMVHCLFVSILLFQGTILGIFAVGQSPSTPALAPPIVFTVLLWAILYRTWANSSYYGSIKACGDPTFSYTPEFNNDFLDPSLRPEYTCKYRFGEEVPQHECPLGRWGRQPFINLDTQLPPAVHEGDDLEKQVAFSSADSDDEAGKYRGHIQYKDGERYKSSRHHSERHHDRDRHRNQDRDRHRDRHREHRHHHDRHHDRHHGHDRHRHHHHHDRRHGHRRHRSNEESERRGAYSD